MDYKKKITTLIVSSFAGLLFIQAVIWGPEVAHYHVPRNSPSDSTLAQAIVEPDAGFPAAIGRIDFGLTGDLTDIETVLIADSMLDGTLDFPGFSPEEIQWPFEKRHLLLGGPSFQLKMAGLAWVEVALDAWRLTGDVKYVDFAKQNVLRFIEFEERQVLPIGYLWNDHALANRAVIYSQMWAALSAYGPIERETASVILSAVDSTASLLAKPSHYTFRTNHGLMQNVALILTAAAFPWIDKSEIYKRTGYDRLARQMEHLISRQGAILEHSAGYHEFGVILLRSCFELLKSMSMQIPQEWRSRLQRSEELLYLLSRPDHSIPNFGDSQSELRAVGRAIVGDLLSDVPQTHNSDGQIGRNGSFLIDAGHAVFRNGIGKAGDSGVHATVTWSNFVSGAHKHADELGINYWSDGTDWWTGSGYWPYGSPHRDAAIGWEGSNAPHYLGEKSKSDRSSSLVAVGSDGDYSVWVLRRRNKDGYDVSRQVILYRDLWALVIDAFQDRSNRPTEIIWGVPPDITINLRGERSAELKERSSDQAIGVSVSSESPLELEVLRGSLSPFGGWMASKGQIRPSSAIRMLSEATGVVAIAWGKETGPRSDAAINVAVSDWQGDAQWSVDLRVDGREQSIRRTDSKLVLTDQASTEVELRLAEPVIDQTLSAETEAYSKEAMRAQVYPDYFPWRLKASKYFVYLLIGFVGLIGLLPRKTMSALFPYALSLIPVGALALGAYLQFVYFVP